MFELVIVDHYIWEKMPRVHQFYWGIFSKIAGWGGARH